MNTATITQIENNNLQPRRTANGGLIPVVGTSLSTPYGDARIVGYDDGNLKVEITDYNEDVTNVDEKVAELAKARNRGIDCLIETINRCDTGTVKAIRERIEALENRRYNELQFRFQLSPSTVLGSGTLYHCETQVITDEEQRRRKAVEVATAKRLAKELLERYEETETPQDVLEEIAQEFGEEF